MAEPDLTEEGWAALDERERKAVASLQRLAARWPRSLTLLSMGASLCVVRTGDERLDAFDSADRCAAIVANVDGIPNDGGDW